MEYGSHYGEYLKDRKEEKDVLVNKSLHGCNIELGIIVSQGIRSEGNHGGRIMIDSYSSHD